MKKVLSLDISSSTIGWSVIRMHNSGKIYLDSFGHVKPPSKSAADKKGFGLSYRLNETSIHMKNLVTKIKPNFVVVEDYAKKFSRGKSSANTIIILATVNEIVSLECFKHMKKEVVRMPVSRVRKFIKEKYSKTPLNKEEIMPLMSTLFEGFVPTLNKVGNIKKECYDEADALAVGLAFCIERIGSEDLIICQK